MKGESVFGWREEKQTWREPQEEYAPYKRYVEKQQLPVVVYTQHHRIEGNMHVTYHHRALDILNGPECYVPITSVRVFNVTTDELVVERDFVAVSKSHLIMLYETGEARFPDQANEGEGAGAAGTAGEGAESTDAASDDG